MSWEQPPQTCPNGHSTSNGGILASAESAACVGLIRIQNVLCFRVLGLGFRV